MSVDLSPGIKVAEKNLQENMRELNRILQRRKQRKSNAPKEEIVRRKIGKLLDRFDKLEFDYEQVQYYCRKNNFEFHINGYAFDSAGMEIHIYPTDFIGFEPVERCKQCQ